MDSRSSENLTVPTGFLSLKRGILAQARISQCQQPQFAISRPGEATLAQTRIFQYSPVFHPPRLQIWGVTLPTAFSDNNYQAPPTNQFDMPVAPEFQQSFESQTQTNIHPHSFTQQTPVPQQQPFQFQSFGALSDYSISHQFGSSSHYEESLPTIFGMTSTTPLSAFNSQQYSQPTMPTQVDDEDDEDDDEEDEEVPQLVRGRTRQPTQPSLRV
ncbi:hypothetical protein Lal_00032463 [Lupinus albus]|nr:hypothetical protein Lal_00032463 [Lupinus albus]